MFSLVDGLIAQPMAIPSSPRFRQVKEGQRRMLLWLCTNSQTLLITSPDDRVSLIFFTVRFQEWCENGGTWNGVRQRTHRGGWMIHVGLFPFVGDLGLSEEFSAIGAVSIPASAKAVVL